MSDIALILTGLGIITAVLLFIVWYFRAPPGVGKKDPASRDENIRTNSSGPDPKNQF